MIYDFEVKVKYEFPNNGKSPHLEYGKHCFMIQCPEEIKKELGLENEDVRLKVFYREPLGKYKKGRSIDYSAIRWGDDPFGANPKINNTILEGTTIQNICHYEGIAPRIWAIITVIWNGRKYLAQVTEYVNGRFLKHHKHAEEYYKKMQELEKKYGFISQKDIFDMWDIVGNKIVDFQNFWFTIEAEKKLREIYKENTKWGKIYYQAIPELDMNGGPRKTETRIKELGLDKINFEGKTFLDIGCSGGVFVNYALKRGAKMAVGLDYPKVVEASKLVSTYLHYFNAQYYGVDLLETTTEKIRELTGIEKFDIVFYLSMLRHIHFPNYLWELSNGLTLIEWNNWKTREEIRDLVKTKFDILEMGDTTDHGSGKEYYLCKSKVVDLKRTTMSNAKKSKSKVKETSKKEIGETNIKIEKSKRTPEDVLREAKKLGMFKFNKMYSQYEIIIPIEDYETL